MREPNKNVCSDGHNCNMLECIMQIGNHIKRDRMESDPELMYRPYTEDEFGPIFFIFCPFCGYRYGDGI